MSCDPQRNSSRVSPGKCGAIRASTGQSQGSVGRQSNFWTAVPPETCQEPATTNNNFSKEASQLEEQQPEFALPYLDPSGEPINPKASPSCGQFWGNQSSSTGLAPSTPVQKSSLAHSTVNSPPILSPAENICVSSTNVNDTSAAAPSPKCEVNQVKSNCGESSSRAAAVIVVVNNDSCDGGSQGQPKKIEDAGQPTNCQHPPSPELRESFRKFALGISEPDTDNDEAYDPVQVCENIFGASLKEGKDGELQELTKVEPVREETLMEKLARICYDDGTKTKTFKMPDEDDYVCPPMPPSNVPRITFPKRIECPPRVTVPRYPVPADVKIVPMSKGIRTNFDRNPNCFTCGAQRQKKIEKLCKEKCANEDCPALFRVNEKGCNICNNDDNKCPAQKSDEKLKKFLSKVYNTKDNI